MKTAQPAFLIAALFFFSAAEVLAQEEERPFDASISLGYVGTTGNTETETFNSELLVSYSFARWLHRAKFQALGSQENQVTKAERYYLENKSDFSLNQSQYLFAKVSYTDDRFSGFDYQAAVSGGYGHRLVQSDKLDLDAYAGLGYRESEESLGNKESEVIFSLGQNLDWDLSDSARVTQSFNTEIGDEITVSRFEIGLVSNIIDRISTKIAFQLKNTSKVPLGAKKTDTQTSVSLVYSF